MEAVKELENFSGVEQFSYTGHDCSIIPAFLLKYSPGIKQLNLSHNCLTNVNELIQFKVIEELTIDNNYFNDSSVFPFLPTLNTLMMNNNLITDLKCLLSKLSISFPSLVYLSLIGNEVCPVMSLDQRKYQDYRCCVASYLPRLKFLDWKLITDKEIVEGCRVHRKPLPSHLDGRYQSSSFSSPDNSFGNSSSENNGTHQKNALLGRLRYVYSGKQSEGNRFIRNNDL